MSLKGTALCDRVDDNVLYRRDEVVPFLLLQLDEQ